jgi:hypothetical protein
MNFKTINVEDLELVVANASKPISNSNFSYPLNNLDDRIYEILTYSLFKRKIENNDLEIVTKFDNVVLMQGVGEKGMDCILLKNNKIVGLVQCKKYSKNLSDGIIIKEIVKFCLHFFLDKERFDIQRRFTYYLATTTGFTGKSIDLIQRLGDKSYFNSNKVFDKIVEDIILKYNEFESIIYEDVKQYLINIISRIKFELLRPEDYNLWINSYPEIIETFFEIKKVTDNSLIEKKTTEILGKIEGIFNSKENENVEDFISKYKKAAIEKLNVVNFIGFDLHRYRQKPTDITLTELFVQPAFYQRINEKTKKVINPLTSTLKISNVFKSEKNIIILGDPGAGKSLLVKFLIVQILKNNEEKLGLRHFENHIPFRIELRKYNEVCESKSVIEYLLDILIKEYQIIISLELLTKILKNLKTVIFFDGLDEIFNVKHKNNIKEYIELFSSNYTNTKCIVTSRFIGYHDIKFNSKHFDEFAIQRFNQKQTEELITKFYATQIGNSEKRKVAIENCISQIQNDVDIELKSNPLIMTLILILTSNNIVIPDSKLEIYEACTKTLVDTIDTREKEMKFEMPVKNKRLTFAHLAYWQYESLSKNREVSYDKAIKSIAELLLEKKEVEEYVEAEEKAKKFLEYAEKRSIYFEDNFTHKTFLEYYTADYLYINFFTKASDQAKKKAISLITTYLPKSFWYIVFELLLTRIDKEQADSELLDEIFTKQIEASSLNVFYFLVSNLAKFVNVSNSTKAKILKKTIRLCIKGEKVTELRKANFDDDSLLSKINQLQNNDSLFHILQDVMFEFENDGLSEKELIEFYILYNEILSLNSINKASNTLTIKNKFKLEELAFKDINLFCQTFVKRKKEEVLPIKILVDQIQNFGIKSLFKDLDYRHREYVKKIDTFDIYLLSILDCQDFISFKKDYYVLLENGLKKEDIVDHIKTSRLYYFHKSEGYEKILSLYLKSDDKDIDDIIVSLLKNDGEIKIAYDKFKLTNSSPKFKILDKLLSVRRSM